MDKIIIRGGIPLTGEIDISGAKNAALPLMATALLTDDPLVLKNIPDLEDIRSMATLLEQHGVACTRDLAHKTMSLKANNICNTTAPYEIVRKMRASVLVLGPLLARFGEARVSLPGGCAIGTRPVDIHLNGFRELGATIILEEGYIVARAPRSGLVGAPLTLPFASVGATENLLMAACLARGETTIINAAQEPEIVDLANCLKAMGAHIQGAGTGSITIQGVSRLTGTNHSVIADRIETGTYTIAAAITGGNITLKNTSLTLIPTVSAVLQKAGVILEAQADGFRAYRTTDRIEGVDLMTEPFPGFATDLQAQMMALMTTCRGAALITETIFENRFMHTPELCRMGANITVQGASALVRGVDRLKGAPVMATDLRASVSLVLAGLAAEGETVLSRIYHLDRGYERVEDKLRGCGADITRLKEHA